MFSYLLIVDTVVTLKMQRLKASENLKAMLIWSVSRSRSW